MKKTGTVSQCKMVQNETYMLCLLHCFT